MFRTMNIETPLAESSPKAAPRTDGGPWTAKSAGEDNGDDSSDSDSLGEELLSDFQSLVCDTKDMSRSLSSLDIQGTQNVSPEKVQVLANCIQDLDDQKEVLFSTISRLECSAAQRSLDLGRKYTAACLRTKELEAKSARDEETIVNCSEEIEALRNDVETLLSALATAFCDGEWQCFDVELKTADSGRLPGKDGALSVEGLQVLKLEAKLSEQQSELETFRREVTRLREQQEAGSEQQYYQLQDELSSCRNQGEGLHHQLSVRETELSRLNKEMSQLTKEIANKDQSSADDHALIQQLQVQYECCLGEMAKLKTTIEELEPQISCLTHDVTRLEKELAVSQGNAQTAQQEVSDLKRDLETVQASAAQDASVWQTEISRRDTVLEQLRTELASCQDQYDFGKSKIQEREDKISQLERQQAKCSNEILEREKSIALLEASLSSAQDTAVEEVKSIEKLKQGVEQELQCRDQLLAAVSVELSAIRRHYKDCCEKMHRLNEQQQDATEQRDSIDHACSECGEQMKTVRRQLSALTESSGVSSDYVDGLATSLNSIVASGHQSSSSSSSAPQRGTGTDPTAAIQSELELRVATAHDLRSEIAQCHHLHQQISSHVEQRQQYLDSLQPVYQRTEKEIDEYRAKIEELRAQTEGLKQRQQNVHSQIACKDEELKAVRADRERHEQMYHACCQLVHDQEESVKTLSTQYDDVVAEMSVQVDSIYQLRTRGCTGSGSVGADDGGNSLRSNVDDVFTAEEVIASDGDQVSKKLQSKMDDISRLVSQNAGVVQDVGKSGGDRVDGGASSDSDKRDILLSAMIQREEALAWLRVHNDALRRLQEKTSSDVERRRQRVSQLERQLGLVS